MSNTINAADLMDINELAAMLGLKRETVRWYLCQKPERLPPRVSRTISRKPLFSRAVVALWLANCDGMAELQARLAPPPKPPIERPPRVARTGRPRRVPQAA